MARKNVLQPYKLIVNGNMGATNHSAPVKVLYTDNIGIEVAFTGTPSGVFTIEGAVIEEQDIALATWVDFGITPTMTASGSASSFLISLNEVPYSHIRITYTRTSGTGSLNVTITAKSVGA
jgi:hypothetical protein